MSLDLSTLEVKVKFSQFHGRRYINLESYKKDGTPKLTPVQSIEGNNQVYFRTDPNSWKVKRIRRNPHVRIVPSDRNGNPKGEWVEGQARVLEGLEADRATSLFRKEYGVIGTPLINLIGRLMGHSLTTVVAVSVEQ